MICFGSTSFVVRYYATQAPVLFAACKEALLWVICNVCGQDRKNVMDLPVCTGHRNSILTSFHQRFEKQPHTVVPCLVSCVLVAAGFECSEFRDRQISYQNHGTRQRLPAQVFGNISYGQIDRPSRFIAIKIHEMCLIRRENDRRDDSA